MILRYGLCTILLVLQVRCRKPANCDPSLNGGFREGILGQVGMFPWLGVIRVQLYEGEKIRVALTGAILIKEKFAMVVADDVARIPHSIFQRDTQALFIPNDGEPWLCKLKNYTTHPEYPAVTNTIALIELELEDKGPVPLVPICWPPKGYNASNQMYVFGITDANDILEKEAYKVQYVQPTKCRHWYRTEGLETASDRRREYQCAAAENSKRPCVYETGMVLASNATGPWVLLGFGIHGPGCASPARFIEIRKYLPWIASVVTTNVKKTILRTGLDNYDIPVHKLFRSREGDDDKNDTVYRDKIVPWIFDRYESGLVPEISRLDQDSIILFSSKYEWEMGDCTKTSKLVYSDSFKLDANLLGGKAFYTLSLMDLSVFNYTCVLIRVEAKQKSKAKLWYNYGSFIDTLEGVDETPKQLAKKYQVPRRQTNATTPKTKAMTKVPDRIGRRKKNSNSLYKNLISDSLIHDLQGIKNDLEAIRKELNITGKADIDKTFRKIFAIKGQLTDVRDKLEGSVPDSLKTSIDILDKAGSELRAGKIYYQGKLMNVKQQEVQQIQQSIDLIKEFREDPEAAIVVETTIKKPEKKRISIAKGRQGKKPWIPHEFLEPEFITDKPGWWLYHPHLNLELEFQWDSEAEMMIEIYSHLKITRPTRGPDDKKTTRTRNMTEDLPEDSSSGGFDVNKLPAGITLPPNIDPKDMPSDFLERLPPGFDPYNPPAGFTFTPPSKSFFRQDSDFKTYAELKRAEYDELEVIKTKGIGLYEEMTDASDIVKLERLCLVGVVFWLILQRFVSAL